MQLKDVIKAVSRFFDEVLDLRHRVIGVTPGPDGWHVLVEAVVPGQTISRRRLLSIYEVEVDRELEVLSLVRKQQIERGALW